MPGTLQRSYKDLHFYRDPTGILHLAYEIFIPISYSHELMLFLHLASLKCSFPHPLASSDTVRYIVYDQDTPTMSQAPHKEGMSHLAPIQCLAPTLVLHRCIVNTRHQSGVLYLAWALTSLVPIWLPIEMLYWPHTSQMCCICLDKYSN